MAKQIQEFDLTFTGEQPVILTCPLDTEIIGVRLEGSPGSEVIKLFAIVDPTQGPENRTFALFKTGDTLPDTYKKFIGVFKLVPPTGEQFFYIFEI